MYVTGDRDVKLRGNSQLVSVLYAPYSKVVLENDGQLTGSFVGREVEMKDRSRVHYAKRCARCSNPNKSDRKRPEHD